MTHADSRHRNGKFGARAKLPILLNISKEKKSHVASYPTKIPAILYTWKSSNMAACFKRSKTDTVAPSMAATTGCATALSPASKPSKPPALNPPVPGLAGIADIQTSSRSSLSGVGLAAGEGSALSSPASAAVDAPVSWRQYSPKNQ